MLTGHAIEIFKVNSTIEYNSIRFDEIKLRTGTLEYFVKTRIFHEDLKVKELKSQEMQHKY